jgi:hypothetical protein
VQPGFGLFFGTISAWLQRARQALAKKPFVHEGANHAFGNDTSAARHEERSGNLAG